MARQTEPLSQNGFPFTTLLAFKMCVLGCLSFKRPTIKQDNSPKLTDSSRTLPSGSGSCCAAPRCGCQILSGTDRLVPHALCVIYQLQTYVGDNLISILVGHRRFLSVAGSYCIRIPRSYAPRLEGVFIKMCRLLPQYWFPGVPFGT